MERERDQSLNEDTDTKDVAQKDNATEAGVPDHAAQIIAPLKSDKTHEAELQSEASGSHGSQMSETNRPPKHHLPHPDGGKVKALAFAFLFIIGASTGYLGGWLASRDQDQSTKTQQVILKSQGDLISNIAHNVGQSVVSVEVTTSSALDSSLFSQMQLQDTEQQSAGTGIVLSEDGLIITNRHVVPSGAQKVSVTLSDGTTYDNVSVIGRTNSRDTLDIAFLKINDTKGKKLVAADLGDSAQMKVGASVVAIGNALGQFQNTVTSGIISGHGRSVQASSGSGGESENLEDLFQTDAAINEGNSGGPLVNMDGQVIGINTAVAGNAQSIGFAIPINDVKGLIKSVNETGKLTRPYLGVVYVSLTDDIAKQYNLSAKRGAYVPPQSALGEVTIIPGSPAAKAGLKEGDIITKVNETTINEQNSLTATLGQYSPNDVVKLIILRDGKQMTIDATLGTAPSEE